MASPRPRPRVTEQRIASRQDRSRNDGRAGRAVHSGPDRRARRSRHAPKSAATTQPYILHPPAARARQDSAARRPLRGLNAARLQRNRHHQARAWALCQQSRTSCLTRPQICLLGAPLHPIYGRRLSASGRAPGTNYCKQLTASSRNRVKPLDVSRSATLTIVHARLSAAGPRWRVSSAPYLRRIADTAFDASIAALAARRGPSANALVVRGAVCDAQRPKWRPATSRKRACRREVLMTEVLHRPIFAFPSAHFDTSAHDPRFPPFPSCRIIAAQCRLAGKA